MTYLIIILAIVFITICVLYAKKVDNNPNHPYNLTNKKKKSIDNQEDKPIGFGYKCMWIAVKTENQNKLADTIGIKQTQVCNWDSGIDHAYKDSVFITPAIDSWTLIVGYGLPACDSEEDIEKMKKLLMKLSLEYGESQYFCTHRVVEYHCWIKSTNGKVDRVYSYLGDQGKNLVVEGVPTEIEKPLKLINTLSDDLSNEDSTYPDEELVMKISENWSVNPTALDERVDIKGLGLLGKIS